MVGAGGGVSNPLEFRSALGGRFVERGWMMYGGMGGHGSTLLTPDQLQGADLLLEETSMKSIKSSAGGGSS